MSEKRVLGQVGDYHRGRRGARLAFAEIAIDAGEPDLALIALVRARELGGEDEDHHLQRLLREVWKTSRDSRPEVSLAGLLERFPPA